MTGIIAFVFRLLLALSLLSFVTVLFLTIWRQLKTQIKMISPEFHSRINLTPVDMDEAESFEISQSEVLIGRDPNCKIHIPNETVSALHARLFFADQHWWINDLSSTNGTFLNDEIIDRPCVLTENDILSFGEVKFKVQIFSSSRLE